MVGATDVLIVKLFPALRALIKYVAASEAPALLHVTLNLVPKLSSKVTKIWLSAPTAVVFTATVVTPAAITTAPATFAPQTAGEADEEQLVAVLYDADVVRPST